MYKIKLISTENTKTSYDVGPDGKPIKPFVIDTSIKYWSYKLEKYDEKGEFEELINNNKRYTTYERAIKAAHKLIDGLLSVRGGE